MKYDDRLTYSQLAVTTRRGGSRAIIAAIQKRNELIIGTFTRFTGLKATQFRVLLAQQLQKHNIHFS